ncbi:hypothetical protein D9M68_780970 [compost metagenome]
MSPLLQDVPQQRLNARLISERGLPALGGSRCRDLIELAILEKQTQARLDDGLEHPSQLLGRPIGLVNGRSDLGLDLAQAVRANHLANGLLGLKKFVDVGLRKADDLREVGNGRFFVAIAAEVLRGSDNDLVSHLVVGRASGRSGGSTCFLHGLQLTPVGETRQLVTVWYYGHSLM